MKTIPPPRVLPPAELAALAARGKTLDYQGDIQPILDRRCVVCHSCYNSPCQLKMTSFEGLARGATKTRVYDGGRLRDIEPTRLFVDAKTTAEWREREFADVTGGDSALGPDSFMFQLLDLKQRSPEVEGKYNSESGDLTCSQSEGELKTFIEKNPHAGMPFGFPELAAEERETLKAWLAAGAKGPDPGTDQCRKKPSNGAAGEEVLRRWEEFLNGRSPKMITTARYLYEHLFLAHLYFDEIPGDFYILARSRAPRPEPIDEIPTVRPFDDPGGPFTYRFRRIHSTIVHKTHILYRLSDAKMERFRELFLQPDWIGESIVVPSYHPDDSANAFKTFRQIPAGSRYRFLLDDAHYFVMSFIRGPVCKGQVALNVINDHFWMMFLDPEADVAVTDAAFIEVNIENLRMPIERHDRFERKAYLLYREAQKRYVNNRTAAYTERYPGGLGLGQVWAGDHAGSQPFLTVYRHFDSATVVPGPVGGLPRTGWVVDYPLFERIYYNLVAGFNVFSDLGEQVGIRLYMDLLRREAEMHFVNFLPAEVRKKVWRSWYPGLLSRAFSAGSKVMFALEMPTGVPFPESYEDPLGYRNAFFDLVLGGRLRRDIGYRYDPLNYHLVDPPAPPAGESSLEKHLDERIRTITHRSGGFVRAMPGKGDVAFVRIQREDAADLVYTAILNRYHVDVAFMEGEKLRLDRRKDTIHVVKGFLGSYPNAFWRVKPGEARMFFEMLQAIDERPDFFYEFFERFGVKRSDPDFWEMSDFFNDRFQEDRPLEAGIFDLNRYVNDPRPPNWWARFRFNRRLDKWWRPVQAGVL